jgi:CRP-like cAMP-binding protein
MVRVLGNMLRASFDIIAGLSLKDVQGRLVDFLLAVAEPAEEGGEVARLDITLEELARMICASRQTVSGLLSELSRRGLVAKRGRGVYHIPDPQALRDL